jgi:hypothetical protein
VGVCAGLGAGAVATLVVAGGLTGVGEEVCTGAGVTGLAGVVAGVTGTAVVVVWTVVVLGLVAGFFVV